MGKKGKKAQAAKPKKLTPKDVGKRLDVLAKKLEEETEGADLFAPLPPTEDCAICLVPLSRNVSNSTYFSCCGNVICTGCVQENVALIKKQNEEKSAGKKIAITCPFCRESVPASDENVRRLEARASKNDYNALYDLGSHFMEGEHGLPQDYLKALDYFIKAVELGSPEASVCIGNSYSRGDRGVNKDTKRSALFYLAAALRGSIQARHNVGSSEYCDLGNHEVAIRHWKIAAEGGLQKSLDALKAIYNGDGEMPGKEFISKEYLESTYRAGHDAQMEVKTEEREKHCAGNDAANMKWRYV